MVDVGKETVPETYINESDVPGAFTVHEGISDLRDKFAQGVRGYDCADHFNNLDEKALEASYVMEADYMVSGDIQKSLSSLTLPHCLVLFHLCSFHLRRKLMLREQNMRKQLSSKCQQRLNLIIGMQQTKILIQTQPGS